MPVAGAADEGQANASLCTGSTSIAKYTHSSGFGNQTFKMALHLEVRVGFSLGSRVCGLV